MSPHQFLSTDVRNFSSDTDVNTIVTTLQQQASLPDYIVFPDISHVETASTFMNQYEQQLSAGEDPDEWLKKRLQTGLKLPQIDLDTKITADISKAVVQHNREVIGVFINNKMGELNGSRLGELIPANTQHQMLESLVPPLPQMTNGSPGRESRAYFLNAGYNKSVKVEEELLLMVSIDLTQEDGPALPLMIEDESIVEIVVSPKNNLVPEGKQSHSIKIPDDTGKKYRFRLRAADAGTGRFIIYAFIDGTELAHIELEVTVIAADSPATNAPQSIQSLPVNVHYPGYPADLSLLITDSTVNDKRYLYFKLTAADSQLNCYFQPYGPVPLASDPARYFRSFYKDIEDINLKGEEHLEIATRRMEAKGAELYKALLPADLRQFLWNIKERISTVIINSEEPWIPWEICRMTTEENGETLTDQFFCERFAITRWIPGKKAPKNKLSLSKVALIVPKESNLEYAPEEREQLMELFSHAGIEVTQIPSNYLAVSDALSSGQYDVIHFTGHGIVKDPDNPNSAYMVLDGGQQFSPEDINGKVANLGKPGPVVFFNACQIGQLSMGLTGIGGWAEKMTGAGAGAFIGANWSVFDKFACDFAIAFYTRLIAGATISAAVKEARNLVRGNRTPTWLAYTAFADPNARMTKL